MAQTVTYSKYSWAGDTGFSGLGLSVDIVDVEVLISALVL